MEPAAFDPDASSLRGFRLGQHSGAFCNPTMIMSAFTTIEMSSSLRDCGPSQGGTDGQRGPGHHEGAGTPAGARDSPDDGAEADAGPGGDRAGLTTRHIRRLIKRVAQAGDQGLAPRGRGKPSNRRIPEPVKTTVRTLYEKRYGDFGPTLAAEKLAERHGLTLSDETLRRWLRAHGVVPFTRRTRGPRRRDFEVSARTGLRPTSANAAIED